MTFGLMQNKLGRYVKPDADTFRLLPKALTGAAPKISFS
jgi:hypothetical protein